jgi:HK97 family phage portal protein
MSLITRAVAEVGRVFADVAPTMLNPLDDRNYDTWAGGGMVGNVVVSPETALGISAFWRAVELLSSTTAKLPLVIYRNRPDGGSDPYPAHPLYHVLHDSPNDDQDSFQWREMMMNHALIRGHGYSEKIAGPRGAVDQLVPLHPDRITPKNGEPLPGGGRRFWFAKPDGTKRAILGEDMFHIRGPYGGLSIIDVAKESIGMNLALMRYGASTFAHGARPSAVVESPKVIAGPGRERLRQELEKVHAGPENAGGIALLDEGMKWQQIGMTVADAEFVATMQWTVDDWARWFAIPPHKLARLERSTNNNIEVQGMDFVIDGFMPWAVRWEQAIAKQLMIAPWLYYARFKIQGLMRGDSVARSTYYHNGRLDGWLNADEIRTLEDMNPRSDGRGKEYWTPLNMGTEDAAGQTLVPASSPSDQDEEDQSGQGNPVGEVPPQRLAAFARDAAQRVIHKELAVMSKLALRTAADEAAFEAGVRKFYDEHAAFVARVLQISAGDARLYCDAQVDDLLSQGAAALATWQIERVPYLADLAANAEEAIP